MPKQQSQVIKRYTLPINDGPQDFLMGRIIHVAPTTHHCDQADDTRKLWVWSLEPPRPTRRTLQCFRDNEEIPANARYIATVMIPFKLPLYQLINPAIRDGVSHAFVHHVFELTSLSSNHSGVGEAVAQIDVQNTHQAGNIINEIIGDHAQFAGVR